MKPRILIVEDERHIGLPLKFNCDAEGYETTLVEDGPSALRLFEQNPQAFDLLILDLMLPQMSGYGVLERLRKSGIQVPVLILSARTLSEDRVRGFDLGADQYMTKPFELAELLSRVRSLLQRHSQIRGTTAPEPKPSADVFEFPGVVADFSRHEVSVRGEPRTLTSLEMKLLKFFSEHEGVVLTRNQLLDNVWGLDSNSTARTVDNFIARLRQHFEVDPAKPRHFLSVRGVGYR
ncbi:MAG: response regulator transcription factor, partial [Planctomycetota bacterium]|nr:response regulator transcription factor [Planctomycetota bacterium]